MVSHMKEGFRSRVARLKMVLNVFSPVIDNEGAGLSLSLLLLLVWLDSIKENFIFSFR